MRLRLTFALGVAMIAAPVLAHDGGWAARRLAAALDAYAAHDFTAARAGFGDLADRNSAVAETMLGVMYANGQGVPVDRATAATYYLRAAQRGYAPAQLAFARALATGRGVGRDPEAAWLWARLAQQRGDNRIETHAAALATALQSRFSSEQLAMLDRRLTGWRPSPTGAP